MKDIQQKDDNFALVQAIDPCSFCQYCNVLSDLSQDMNGNNIPLDLYESIIKKYTKYAAEEIFEKKVDPFVIDRRREALVNSVMNGDFDEVGRRLFNDPNALVKGHVDKESHSAREIKKIVYAIAGIASLDHRADRFEVSALCEALLKIDCDAIEKPILH